MAEIIIQQISYNYNGTSSNVKCNPPRSCPGGRPSDHLETDGARPDPLEHGDGLVVTEAVKGLAVD